VGRLKVPVDLPDFVWGRLLTIAEHRNVMVADLVEAALLDVMASDTDRLGELDSELREFKAARKARRNA
jgi:hypothetical protein